MHITTVIISLYKKNIQVDVPFNSYSVHVPVCVMFTEDPHAVCHRSMSKSTQSHHYHPHFLREMDVLFSEERYSVSPV